MELSIPSVIGNRILYSYKYMSHNTLGVIA